MYDRETVELALYALEDGMTQAEAAELVGAARAAVGYYWARSFLPHSVTGARYGSIGPRTERKTSEGADAMGRASARGGSTSHRGRGRCPA